MISGLGFSLWILEHQDIKKTPFPDFYGSGAVVRHEGVSWLLTARHNLLDGSGRMPAKAHTIVVAEHEPDGSLLRRSPFVDLAKPRTFWGARRDDEVFDIICIELHPEEVPASAYPLTFGVNAVDLPLMKTLMADHVARKVVHKGSSAIKVTDHFLICGHPQDGCIAEPGMAWAFSASFLPKGYGRNYFVPGTVGGMSGGPVFRVPDAGRLELLGVVATTVKTANVTASNATHTKDVGQIQCGSAVLTSVLFDHGVRSTVSL